MHIIHTRGPIAIRPDAKVVILGGVECVEVPLTKGKFAIIDRADADAVLQFAWQAKRYGGVETPIWYASRRVRKGEALWGVCQHIKLHQFLLKTNELIDHRNGNGLDNRRGNLRHATPTQNQGNTRCHSGSVLGIKGVSYRPARGGKRARFVVRIGGGCNRVQVGSFRNLEEAVSAYNQAALARWGEFARPNEFASQ